MSPKQKCKVKQLSADVEGAASHPEYMTKLLQSNDKT